jgi:hypothetical protein
MGGWRISQCASFWFSAPHSSRVNFSFRGITHKKYFGSTLCHEGIADKKQQWDCSKSHAGEGVRQQDLSSIAGWKERDAATVEDSWMVLCNTEHVVNMCSSNCVPWYLHKGVENLHTHKILCKDVYDRSDHNCQSIGVTKMFLSRYVDN